MQKHWIVVADGARARFFRRTKRSEPLQEIMDMVRPEARAHDVFSDRKGRMAGSERGGRGGAMESHDSPHDQQVDVFARDIAAELERARVQGDANTLTLIASPHLLGRLRAHISDGVRRLVAREIAKDVVRQGPEAVLRLLDAD